MKNLTEDPMVIAWVLMMCVGLVLMPIGREFLKDGLGWGYPMVIAGGLLAIGGFIMTIASDKGK